ncbi:hypothetical protein [Glaciecola sp. 1036]|uniref:hypothetical protein n=1 Tax=Alteromonadaceae TaxID=72275 RepID=UPI003CFCB398
MGYITITDDQTNEIVKTMWCKPQWQSSQVKSGQTIHPGYFPKRRYTYNGDVFLEVETTLSVSNLPKMNVLLRELYKAGLQLPSNFPDISSKDVAKSLIDQAAGRARARYVSPGLKIDQEYTQLLSQAKDYLQDQTEVPPMIQTWADVSSVTPLQAAQNVLDTAIAWETILNTIYDVRHRGKKAVQDSDLSSFQTVAQSYIDQLEAI